MSKTCLTLGLVLVGLSTGGALRAETAEEMLSSCRLLGEPQVKGQEVKLAQGFETGMCWGAFASIQRVIVKVLLPETHPVFGICAPAKSTRTQIISIFLEYARRNPKKLNEDYFDVAILALQEAFPCRQTVPPR